MGRSARQVLLLAGSILLAAGCGGDDAAAPTAPAASTAPTVPGTRAPSTPGPQPTTPAASTTPPAAPTTSAPTMIDVADGRLAITLALPDEHPVVNAGEHDFAFGPSCITPYWQLAGGIDIEAWPAGCDPANSEPGNGEHGHYRSAADAPSPIDPIAIDTVLGPAEVFGQTYYECTNSCTEWELDIAVITLSEPVSDEYPTLTVIGTVENLTRADLLALLQTFAAG